MPCCSIPNLFEWNGFLPDNKPGQKKNHTQKEEKQAASGANYNWMKKQPVCQRVFFEPGVEVMSVRGAQSHGYVSVKNGEHKRQTKNNGTGKRDCLADVKNFAK